MTNPLQDQPAQQRVALTNYTGRFQPHQPPGCMILMGLIFTAAGGFLLAAFLGYIPMKDNTDDLPQALKYAIPFMFGGPGLMVLLSGVKTAVRRARSRRLGRERPHEPWMADHNWDRAGAWDDTPRTVFNYWQGFILFAVFMAPFHWWAFGDKGVFPVTLVVVIFDLVILFILYKALEWTLRWIRYGRTRVGFESFPYFLGEPIRIILERAAAVDGKEIVARLRCVEPVVETRQSGSKKSATNVFYQVYLDERRFDISDQRGLRGLRLEMEFPLPAGAGLTTSVSNPPIRYWEIELASETPGVDFAASFALPVYARE